MTTRPSPAGPCVARCRRSWPAPAALRLLVTLLAAPLAGWTGPARAQPVLDAAAVPGLDAAGRASYGKFLAANLPRAFASDGHGAHGWSGDAASPEAARAQALAACAAMAVSASAPGPQSPRAPSGPLPGAASGPAPTTAAGGAGCTLYAEGLSVVWGGRRVEPPPPPGPFVSTWNYSLVPDDRYLWRGPSAAAGVYVWAHGSGTRAGPAELGDARGLQPHAHVRAFNNAGWDIVRFDRDPNADARDRAAGWLEDGLADLRRRGYRRVVAGGESRGAWNALQMLLRPGLADAVIAVSPAAHGSGGSPNLTAQYDDLRRMLSDIPPAPARLAFVQFQDDTSAGDLARRAALVAQLRPRLGGLLVLDRPDGLRGHGAGASDEFAERYGGCLLRFVTGSVPPAAC